MDIEAYYRSLHTELNGLRNRVRFLIGNAHWPTDGGWKESVLRAVLRRMIGGAVDIGHGFFVTEEGISPQIDVLAWRSDAPVLFRDGDLVILPAHAVRAVIQVKTKLTTQTLAAGVDNLNRACAVLPSRGIAVTGLFAYETDFPSNEPILQYLRDYASASTQLIDLVCHGSDHFIRYWPHDPEFPGKHVVYEKWHSYQMPELAYGYFISNIISHLAPSEFPSSGEPFYPRGGKEIYKDGEVYRKNALGERWLEFGVRLDRGDTGVTGGGE